MAELRVGMTPFEGPGVRQMIPRQALTVVLGVSARLSGNPEIVIYPGEMESPWVSFNVGERQFGIWKATLELYEADEHGAMGEDALDVATLVR